MRFIFWTICALLMVGAQGNAEKIIYDTNAQFQEQLQSLLTHPDSVKQLTLERTTERVLSNIDPIDLANLSHFENLAELVITTSGFHSNYNASNVSRSFSSAQLHTFFTLPVLPDLQKLTINYGYFTNGHDPETGEPLFDLDPFLTLLSHFSHLQSLNLSNNPGLLRATHNRHPDLSKLTPLTELRELYLDGSGSFDQKTLFGLDQLQNLTVLSYANNAYDSRASVDIIFKLENLEALNINGSFEHYTRGLTQHFKPLAHLKELRMRSVMVDSLAFGHLFPSLELLDIGGTDLSNLNLADLGEFKQLKTLTMDQVFFNKSQERDFQYMVPLESLEELNLTESFVRGFDLSKLGPHLKHLDLTKSNLTNGDATTIQRLKALEWLSLANNNMDGKMVKKLTALPKLKVLKLSGLNMMDADFSGLTALEDLDLSGTTLSPESWESIKELKNLKRLDLRRIVSKYTPAATIAEKLHEALPDCEILK